MGSSPISLTNKPLFCKGLRRLGRLPFWQAKVDFTKFHKTCTGNGAIAVFGVGAVAPRLPLLTAAIPNLRHEFLDAIPVLPVDCRFQKVG